MTLPDNPFQVGDFVKYKVPASRKEEQFAYARVIEKGIEFIRFPVAYVYVRWVSATGEPEGTLMRLHPDELELM